MEKIVKVFFKEGDAVAHKENILVKMEVRKIARKRKSIDEKTTKMFILGIECGWFEGGDYKKELFHSNSLIPWEVAERGYAFVLKYCDDRSGVKR